MFSAAKNRIIHENYQTALMKKFLLNIAASACLVCMATATATSAALKPSAGKRNIPESSVTRDRASHIVPPEWRMRDNGNRTPDKISKTVSSVSSRRLVPANVASDAGIPELAGAVVYSSAWTQSTAKPGLYTIPTAEDEAFTPKFVNNQYVARGGGICVNSSYYYVSYQEISGSIYVYVFEYDTETWEQKRWMSGTAENIAASGMAVDPTTGTVYGFFYNSSLNGYNFGTIDFSGDTPETTKISEVKGDIDVAAIACTKDGELYAITRTVQLGTDSYTVLKSELVKVDKTNGNMTVIGETGMLPYYPTSATIDKKSGRMFWTVCPYDGSGNLCEVNLTTGEASLIYKFPNDEEVQGLYVPDPLAADNAPAAITGLSADFPEGSLSGRLYFTAPATTFSGEAATGELSYKVSINDRQTITGTTSFGAPVEVPVTVESSGDYTFGIRTSNAAGESPLARISLFIGSGVPVTPAPVLTVSDGVATVTWQPVNTVVDKGYINPAEVTYTVRRYPGPDVVADNLKGTTFTETLPAPDGLVFYHYSVAATYKDAVSGEGITEPYMAGSCNMPYSQNFDGNSSLDQSPIQGYTIIDANQDGKMWDVFFGEARMIYNSSLAMDDWLITPPLHLEAGKSYPVSLEARMGMSGCPERLEVKYGRNNTVEGMTGIVFGPTPVTSRNPETLRGFIVAPETGDYYLGLHGISDADEYYLLVDNLLIAEGIDVVLPEAPVITGRLDESGANQVAIDITVPSRDVFGNDLAAISKIELKRNGNVIKTFDNPAPGSVLAFTDVTPSEGNYLYEATPYNGEHAGKTASVNVFVGIDVPAAPATVTIAEAATSGDVVISWDEVSSDVHGTAIKPSSVSYNIYRFINGVPDQIATGIEGTTYTFTAVEEGQEFVQCAVRPVNARGEGAPVLTDMVIAGAPYNTPWKESFVLETMSIFAVDYADKAEWGLVDDTYFGTPSQDNDGAAMSLLGEKGGYSTLVSGKIDLAGLANPGITLYVYNISDEDLNTVELLAGEAGGELSPLGTFVMNQTGQQGWNMISADLSALAGKTIQIGIKATIANYDYILIDNIRVRAIADCDMIADRLEAPLKAKVGKEFQINVTVTNDGIRPASAYTVRLLADGEELLSGAGEELQPGQQTVVSFSPALHPLTTETVEFKATVEIAGDEISTNNTTETVEVKPLLSTLPPVTDLTGESQDGGIALAWSEPDMDTPMTARTTADFEDEVSFTHAIDGWKFIDADKRPVGGFTKFDIPSIVPGATLASFLVFDSTLPVFSENFAAHSGNKFIGAMWRNDNNRTNDWLILPELDGTEQTISFYARSFDETFYEAFTVYGSSTDPEIGSFKLIADVEKVPYDWTLYTFRVPEGTRYFALNSHSSNNYILMLDDFTFNPAPEHKEFSLTGYKVYRDNRHTDTVEENEWLDTEATGKECSYAVTALYDKGESKSSNVVVINTSGTDEIDAARRITIIGAEGTVTITGAEGLATSVCAIDGKTLYTGVAADRTTVCTGEGIFVVTVAGKSAKVIVRN